MSDGQVAYLEALQGEFYQDDESRLGWISTIARMTGIMQSMSDRIDDHTESIARLEGKVEGVGELLDVFGEKLDKIQESLDCDDQEEEGEK